MAAIFDNVTGPQRHHRPTIDLNLSHLGGMSWRPRDKGCETCLTKYGCHANLRGHEQ